MKFRSKYEERIYSNAGKAGHSVEFETIRLPYTTQGRYTPDFILPNGIIVEAKGYFDSRARSKMLAVKRCNPELDIRFLFMDSRKKLRKGSDTTYADWCKRHEFLFADGDSIPAKWFKERKKRDARK